MRHLVQNSIFVFAKLRESCQFVEKYIPLTVQSVNRNSPLSLSLGDFGRSYHQVANYINQSLFLLLFMFSNKIHLLCSILILDSWDHKQCIVGSKKALLGLFYQHSQIFLNQQRPSFLINNINNV